MEHLPDILSSALIGAIEFYDARLVMTLIRTAVKYGAVAASRMKVTEIPRADGGRVSGATVVDLESGREFSIRAQHVINATGVWTE